jgi:TonB family protein
MIPRVILLTAALLATPIAADAQQIVKGGEDLYHQSPLDYPSELRESGTQGTVVIDAWLDARGHVMDARVVTGPMPFRRIAVIAVFGFHFAPPAAEGLRQVSIEYRLPMSDGPNPKGLYKTGPRPMGISAADRRSGIVKTIEMDDLSDRMKQELRARMPIQPGSTVSSNDWPSIQRAIAEIDEHLDLKLSVLTPAANPPALALRIFHPRRYDGDAPPPPPPPPPIRRR